MKILFQKSCKTKKSIFPIISGDIDWYQSCWWFNDLLPESRFWLTSTIIRYDIWIEVLLPTRSYAKDWFLTKIANLLDLCVYIARLQSVGGSCVNWLTNVQVSNTHLDIDRRREFLHGLPFIDVDPKLFTNVVIRQRTFSVLSAGAIPVDVWLGCEWQISQRKHSFARRIFFFYFFPCALVYNWLWN